MLAPKNIALLTSGGASTAEAIIRSCYHGELRGLYRPTLFISNNPNGKGLERVINAGMDPALCYPLTVKKGGEDQLAATLLGLFDLSKVYVVGQYGWLPITPKRVIDSFPGMMINQHPGPLDPGRPDFGGVKPGMYGMRVHCARLYYVRKVKADYWTEATAHFVEEGVDKGAIIHAEKLEILPEDTPESLSKRLLPIEHKVQIEALRMLACEEIVGVTRTRPLVEDENVPILNEAKRIAQLLYPKG